MGLKRTPLHQAVQFEGLVAEHQAVRRRCGIFDISHMGVLTLRGAGAKDALQALVPTDLFRIGPGEACYTVLLNERGGIRNALNVYDRGWQAEGQCHELLLVINAACDPADTTWVRSQLEPLGISVVDRKKDGVLLALQGPEAVARLEELAGTDLSGLPRLGHRELKLAGASAVVGRTSYTGEDGFELMLKRPEGAHLWSKLLASGVSPCGLGALDTLRLEAAIAAYGQELDENTTPLEAGLGWLVHLEMPKAFMGREALERQSAAGIQRRLVGLKLQGCAIASHGYPVLDAKAAVASKPAGQITSGSWSPSLEEAIAMAYVPANATKLGTELAVEIRGQKVPAVVVRRPFYEGSTKKQVIERS